MVLDFGRMKHARLILSILVNILIVSDLAASLYLSKTLATKEVDKSFLIVCRDDKLGKEVTWKGPDGRLLNENTHPKTQAKVYGYTLFFDKIKREDQGIYTCLADASKEVGHFTLNVGDESYENNHRIRDDRDYDEAQPEEGVSTDTIHTSVDENESSETVTHYPLLYLPPNNEIVNGDQLQFVRTEDSKRIKEGATDTIRCEALGGNITWFVNGSEPQKGDKYVMGGDGLIIHNVTKEDGDMEYVCRVVSDTTGSFKDMKIKLIVLRKPRVPENYEKLNVVYGIPGQYVNLTCEADSEPQPTFIWGGFSKKRRSFQEIIENTNTGIRAIYRLYMNNAAPDNYSCVAQNEFGHVRIHYKVEIGMKPDPPKSFQNLEVRSDGMTLEITRPDDNPELPQLFKPTGVQIQYRVFDNRTKEEISNDKPKGQATIRHGWACCWQNFDFSDDDKYTLEGLESETTYEVQVATTNIAGVSDFLEETLVIQTASGTNRIGNVWIGTFLLSISTILLNAEWSRFLPYL